MADHRISHIELDEATILWRNADIEQERRIAIFDLIEENTFQPLRACSRRARGPWRLALSVQDGRLVMEIGGSGGDAGGNDDEPVETLLLGLARFRRPIREYFAICDSAITRRSARPRRGRSRRSTWRGAHSQSGGAAAAGTAGRQDRDRFCHRPAAVHADLRAAYQGLKRDAKKWEPVFRCQARDQEK